MTFLKSCSITVITHPSSQPLPGKETMQPSETEVGLPTWERGLYFMEWISWTWTLLKNCPRDYQVDTILGSALEIPSNWGQGFHRADKCPRWFWDSEKQADLWKRNMEIADSKSLYLSEPDFSAQIPDNAGPCVSFTGRLWHWVRMQG